MNDLKDKAAIVTGASRGIGAATAKELAAHGVAVVLAARTADQVEAIAAEINDQGGQAEAVACDVSVYEDVAKAVARCQDAFGRLDILINNAGVIEPIVRLADSDPDQWGEATDINFKGVYHGLRAAIPVMEAHGRGVIVNISSGAATGALEGWSQYCAAKAAVFALTRCADMEYGDRGIRVVGLSPGTVATDMQVVIKASGVNPVSQLDPSVHAPVAQAARAIVWLCSDDAADLSGVDVSLRDDEVRRRAGIDG
jgi:3-oxoacyl-[acyl-carrier protein] reductase